MEPISTLTRQDITPCTHLVVPEGITRIEDKACCADYTSRGILEQVTLPSTLRHIGESAFQGNINLEEVILPRGLVSIGDSAFSGCTSLKRIIIPASVEQVGINAFCNCKELEEVILEGVFSGRPEANPFDDTYTPASLSSQLFSGCVSLRRVSIPQGFTILGNEVFRDCAFAELELPESLVSIGKSAFSGCVFLKSLRLPKKLSQLGKNALPTVQVDFFIFRSAALTRVETDPENPHFRSVDGVLFTREGELVYCPPGFCAACFEIPDWCVSIRDYALWGNKGIRKLVIPEGVTEIGLRAFWGMPALEEAVFTGSRKKLGKEWFLDCKKLSSVTFPGNLETIGESCFSQAGLASVVFPETLKVLEEYAFSQTGIKSVTVPKSVERIGPGALAGVADITVFDTIDAQAQDTSCLGQMGSNARHYNGSMALHEHTITVRSAETGLVKHTVRMPSEQKIIVNQAYQDAWKPGGVFCYDELDPLFREMTPDLKKEYVLIRLGMWDQVRDENREIFSKYCARSAKDLFTLAISEDNAQTLALLAPHGIVKKANLEDRLEQAAKANAVACAAWLLDWQNRNMSQKEKAKKAENALALKAPTVAEIRKIWPHKKGSDGGITITGYNGEDVDIEVPAVIGKTPVTAIANSCFSSYGHPDRRDFFQSQLRSVVLPDSITSIGTMVFSHCEALESVTLPAKMKKLPDRMFYGCAMLEIQIPRGVQDIGDSALIGVKNETVYLPASVREVHPEAFQSQRTPNQPTCRLREIKVDPGNPTLTAADGVLFSSDGRTLLCYPSQKTGETYRVPDAVRFIAPFAFAGNSFLRRLELPEILTAIGNSAFAGASALESVRMPGKLKKLGGTVFLSCVSLKELTLPGLRELPTGSFAGCSALETVCLPENMETIGKLAFKSCVSLRRVTIPEGLRTVETEAFTGCSALETLTFSCQTTEIRYQAFDGCRKLTIHAPEGSAAWLYGKNNRIPVETT